MSHYWINTNNQQNNWYSSEGGASWGQYDNSQQQSSVPQGKIFISFMSVSQFSTNNVSFSSDDNN